MLLVFLIASVVLGTITASVSHAHGIAHEETSSLDAGAGTLSSAQSHAALSRLAATAIDKRLHCPSGSGGTCCCSGDGMFSSADLLVIACALLLWFMVPRGRAARTVLDALPRPFNRRFAAAQPRAPPISC
jgi:hypothetical protein